jgi:hypothetical protein
MLCFHLPASSNLSAPRQSMEMGESILACCKERRRTPVVAHAMILYQTHL